jgi:hypothetical protein
LVACGETNHRHTDNLSAEFRSGGDDEVAAGQLLHLLGIATSSPPSNGKRAMAS